MLKILNVSNILTDAEKIFISKNNLNLNDFLDARNLTKKQRDELARKYNKKFMVGAPCQKAGHRLRTRYYHCIQCNTETLKHFTRHYVSGILYIAESKSKGWYKVGITEDDVISRLQSLNHDKYGETNDWNIIKHYEVNSSVGKKENSIHDYLSHYSVSTTYIKNGDIRQPKKYSNARWTPL